ncbi:two-CW domain-containing protein [Thermodesulfobacteriota bacterium]
MKKLQNCWEVMECGFGPNGAKTKKHGVCSAALENNLESVHGGIHGGRACWFVKNTSDCGNGAHGEFNIKYPICMNCKFYWQVRDEQGSKFEISLILNTYPQKK